MKVVMVTALMAVLATAGQAAGVNDYGAMVQRHSPICAFGVPRVDRAAALPQACCDGLRCGQMLATTKIDRPRPASHT